MRIIDPGHKYAVQNYESGADGLLKPVETGGLPGLPEIEQTVTFISKLAGVDVYPGTTNEEILAVMIDRMKFLNGKFPCMENALAITKLEEALMWLNRRTELRQAQGVEGQDKPHQS